MRIKDAGVTGAKLAAAIVDDATIEKAANVLRVKDAGITGPKISSLNNARKSVLVFSRTLSSVAAPAYFKIGEVISSPTIGYRMPIAGRVTGLSCVNGALNNYRSDRNEAFAAGDNLCAYFNNAAPAAVYIYKNAGILTSLDLGGNLTATDTIITVLIEFDS